ncbi:MAG: hypothetical protein AAF220_04830 [Pseudomonadota bacterium]
MGDSSGDDPTHVQPGTRDAFAGHPRSTDLLRALNYPYGRPARSFLFAGGTDHPIAALGRHHLAGRTPVIGYGSNASPEQLLRKFGDDASNAIPVLMGRLTGFDTVYSAHITRYGALPATLIESADTEICVALLWLTDPQLERMHETEVTAANYDYTTLSGLALDVELVGKIPEAGAYIGLHGYLIDTGLDRPVGDGSRSGGPIALSAVKAKDRKLPALDQTEALAHAMARLDLDLSLEEFVLRLIDDEAFRVECRDHLRKHG